jgi:hypothetical protein
MNGTFQLFAQREVENSFQHLVDRKVREKRLDERRLAEQRTTKHQFQARKSCVADARRYRIAREFLVAIVTQLDWNNLIRRRRPKYIQKQLA